MSTAPGSAAWWRRIFDIYDHAVELEGDDRAAYLGQTCAGNSALHAEVAALLAGGSAPDFLERPAAEFAGPVVTQLAELEATVPGQRVGPYRLLSEIGHGGMGTVWGSHRRGNGGGTGRYGAYRETGLGQGEGLAATRAEGMT